MSGWRHWARLGALAAGIAGLLALVALSGDLSADRVHDWVDGYGAAGPLVFIALSAGLTCALFPGPLLAGASGLLFGTALGTPVAITAATLGAVLAFTIARHTGAHAVDHLAHGRLLTFKRMVERRGFEAVLYARIAPGVPYSLLNYAAGLTRMSVLAFAAATAIGAAPRAFAYAALGGSFGDFGNAETVIAICVLVGMAAVGALLAWRRRAHLTAG